MKKGQRPPIIGSAGGLIGMITFLIVIIVLLMPPCDRCKLLHEDDECLDVCEETTEGNILLHEYPGDISEENDVRDHELGSINLYLKDEPEIKTLSDSLKVSKSIFGDSYQQISFNVEDIDNLKGVILYFNVYEPKGDLIIDLNGYTVFRGYKKEGAAQIELPVDYLKESNILKISTSTGFLIGNHYTLKEIKLKKVFARINSAQTRTFSVSSNEKNAIKESKLSFFMYCKELKGQGTFKIVLNDEMLVSEPLICTGSKREIELDKENFDSGENVLEFVIDNGDFMFNDILVRNELKEAIQNEYGFELTNDQYTVIRDEEKGVSLTMDLTGDSKLADIIINGYTLKMDTNTDSFKKYITDYIEEGTNTLKIVPKTDFEIDELIIKLED